MFLYYFKKPLFLLIPFTIINNFTFKIFSFFLIYFPQNFHYPKSHRLASQHTVINHLPSKNTSYTYYIYLIFKNNATIFYFFSEYKMSLVQIIIPEECQKSKNMKLSLTYLDFLDVQLYFENCSVGLKGIQNIFQLIFSTIK